MTISSSERAGVADVAVVGAGPAGLAAAITAADAGLTAAVLDLGERIGGQYYRHAAAHTETVVGGRFHHNWRAFVQLREHFERHIGSGRIVHLGRHAVWSIAPGSAGVTVRAVQGELERLPRTVQAGAAIIATGASDRHVAFPGWTLPGVMAGGAAQALLKESDALPGARGIVAGTGPFLLPVADALLAAGVDVAEVVEANAPWAIGRDPRALFGAAMKLPEAFRYGARLRLHGVPYRTRHAVIAAHGEGRLEAVTIARLDSGWKPIPDSERQVDCDLLTVGYGFTPQIELALAAGCEHRLGRDGSLVIAADVGGRTSCPGVYAAGETTGVGGADLAIIEGTLCGEAVAADLGSHPPPRSGHQRLRLRARALRRFVQAMHETCAVNEGWIDWLSDDTVVCRCEEVNAADIRAALRDLGAGDVRTVKLLARPGMGWCQGRICGCILASMVARHGARSVTADDLVGASRRVIGTPVPLGHLAALEFGTDTHDAPHAVGKG